MNLVVTEPSLIGLEAELVYKLKICYLDIFLEDKVNDCDNWFINAIQDSVLQGNQELHNLFTDNADTQYRTDTDNTIYSKFMQHIEPLINSVFQLANSIQNRFNASTDLVGILSPFILQKMQICNEDVGVFIGVGVIIAQLIVQRLAEQEIKKREKEMHNSIESICHSNLIYLHQLAEKNSENKEIIEQCIDANNIC